jgi:hypothetical protein
VDREDLYRLAVRQTDVLEIEDQSTAFFLLQQAPKSVHVVSSNPPTDAQEHTILSDCLAVDSEGQCERPNGFFLLSPVCNRFASRNSLKTNGRDSIGAHVDILNFANFTKSTILMAILPEYFSGT